MERNRDYLVNDGEHAHFGEYSGWDESEGSTEEIKRNVVSPQGFAMSNPFECSTVCSHLER